MRVHFISDAWDAPSLAAQHALAMQRHGAAVTTDLTEEGCGWRALVRDTDVVHLTFGLARDYATLRRVRTARMCGAAVVRYWNGLDVLWANAHAATRRIGRALADLGVMQWAPNEAVAAALAHIGINADIVPPADLNVSADAQPHAFPKTFTLLVHLPAERRELCGGGIVDSLIDRLPGVRFLILGDDAARYAGRQNVEVLGPVDDMLRTLVRATAVLDVKLFPSAHRLAIEAMSMGRHVITTAAVPHARHADSADALVGAVALLRRDPHFNLEGREYTAQHHDGALRATAILERFRAAIEPGRTALAMRGSAAGARLALTFPAIYSRRPVPPPMLESVPSDDPVARVLLASIPAETVEAS